MRKLRRTLVGAVAAATFLCLGAGTAHGTVSGGNAREPVATGGSVNENSAPDRDARPSVEASPAANAALAKIQQKIADYVAKHGARYTFGSYMDSGTGKIVLQTDAPQDVVSTVTDLSGASPSEDQMAREVQVQRGTIRVDQLPTRRDDTPPFYGGAGIKVSGRNKCSAGYTVQDATGTRFMVTAGHCFATGANVVTESGKHTFGTVSNQHLPTVTPNDKIRMDVELIGGQHYASQIYGGSADSNWGYDVVAAGDAVEGYDNYCVSGRTTGETCGHTDQSNNGQFCVRNFGCDTPAIAYTEGTSWPGGGDSGAPFYAKADDGQFGCTHPLGCAWIRGHQLGIFIDQDTGKTTGYAEPWTTVSTALGLSIVSAP